ncbi:MAG: hypothetical protein PHW19_07615 [Salinivirgaceae bacterium]|nr:hypothetical protein [Salinivirgaceae bacterium]
MILKLTITVFLTQLIFIGCRTWNVRAVSKGNLKHVLVSGAIVHISWLASIAIGAVSMNEIIVNFDWQYLPVIVGSLSGGLIGSWIGLKERVKK